jgi:alkanesulfonate monooxygenase SsuD/methylene tetrahydromethanopterin reductase-like flavin-dependent oxidoreductase (luciferase family)
MRFGVSLLPDVAASDEGTSVEFDRLLRLACRADELGYEQVQISQLPLPVIARYAPDPVPLLSAVAALTVGIRVGIGVVVPDRAHALEVAERLAILDNLSHGRLDVTFHRAGAAAWPWPLRALPRGGRDRHAEGIDICRRLWSGQGVGSALVSAAARSYQRPHPPIFRASAADVSACAQAGRDGYHLELGPAVAPSADWPEMVAAYHAGRATAGLAPGRVRLDYTCYVAENDQSARRRHADHPVFAGDPAQLRDQISGIADNVGENVSLQVKMARVPGVSTEQALEVFGEQVMPYFLGDSAGACQGA